MSIGGKQQPYRVPDEAKNALLAKDPGDAVLAPTPGWTATVRSRVPSVELGRTITANCPFRLRDAAYGHW
jgi:hypothetical protein